MRERVREWERARGIFGRHSVNFLFSLQCLGPLVLLLLTASSVQCSRRKRSEKVYSKQMQLTGWTLSATAHARHWRRRGPPFYVSSLRLFTSSLYEEPKS